MKMLFLSPNQEVDCDKKEESYLLFYGDTTPPPPPPTSAAYGRDRDEISKRLLDAKDTNLQRISAA